jgi:uncharacterized protein (TIGR02996 family)
MTSNSGDRDALLAAILAQPDDDVARLVYADWLQENGQEPRAQFIRAQVWASQAEPFSKEARKQAAVAKRILEASSRGEWTRHLQQRMVGWEFRRGFVEHVRVNVATFAHDAEELFRREPIRSLQMIRFASNATTVPLEPFFETPQLERITRLEMSGRQFSPVEMEMLSACPYLDGLTELCLREAPVMPPWFGSLLTGGSLPALAGLDLSGLTHLGPQLAESLPDARHRRFARLNLSGVRLTSHELKLVLDSDCVREVAELRLGWAGAGQDGAVAHVNAGWVFRWAHLRLLDLDGQRIGDDGVNEIMKALARRPGEAPLRWLGLANNGLGADGVRAILNTPESKLRLHHLDVRGNGLTIAQLAALQSRFPDAVIDG